MYDTGNSRTAPESWIGSPATCQRRGTKKLDVIRQTISVVAITRNLVLNFFDISFLFFTWFQENTGAAALSNLGGGSL